MSTNTSVWARWHAPPKCAARHALYACYWVAYAKELTPVQRRGMRALEATGEVVRDEGGHALHWHRQMVAE